VLAPALDRLVGLIDRCQPGGVARVLGGTWHAEPVGSLRWSTGKTRESWQMQPLEDR